MGHEHICYVLPNFAIDLLAHLGRDKCVWVGHDWGSPVVWNIASHHPSKCVAVANLCVPYRTVERGLDNLVNLVGADTDRVVEAVLLILMF